ncbi:MAG: hypothetical protein JNM25_12625 [Planctomycetes bacterium]|nr:hypothetical protein [Planctomycetota bacterium]
MSARRRHLLAGLLTGLAVAAGAPASPAQTNAAADPTPDTAAITAVLAGLDACFARGDLAAYLAAFEPDHVGAHALLRQHLERLAALDPGLVRTSAPVTPPRQIGPRTVVRVRHTLRTGDERTLLEDTMLAVRRDPDGRLVPTFAVEIPTQWGCVRDDHFRCPACNYEIGGVDGWLCVPVRPERARALEAASFYLLGTDVACDVSVVIDAAAPAAATVVRGLAAALAGLDAGARPGPVEAWLPPAHTAAPPPGFAGARVEISLPRDFDGRGGIACFYVLTFGGLQHVLLVRGSGAALDRHAADVQALLASYRMVQTDLDLALAAAQPLQHHTGGTLTDADYRNARFGFTFAGPAGWHAELRCGGAALRVLWSSSAGSRLWLTGYDVPAGLDRWCRRTADRWLQQLLQRADLEQKPAPAGGDGWTDHTLCGGGTRALTCVARNPEDAAAARERTIRVFLQDDLLLVADLGAANDADAAAMRAAVETLRRP